MRMETRRKEVMYTNVTVYVADDGTEFKTSWECERYEHEQVYKPLLEKLQRCEELDGYPNFDGQEYAEHHDYCWYFIRDLSDLVIIDKVYPDTTDVNLSDRYIGKWMCIETDDDGNGWSSTLDDGIEYATALLKKLGYKVEITKE